MPKVQSNINLLSSYGKNKKPKRYFWGFYISLVHVFALAGLFFIGSFALSKLNLTNVSGGVDLHNSLFKKFVGKPLPEVRGAATPTSLASIQQSINELNERKLQKMQIFCQISAINQEAGANAADILNKYKAGSSDSLTTKMLQAVRLRLGDESDSGGAFDNCTKLTINDSTADFDAQSLPSINNQNIYSWTQDETWPVLSAAITKDKDVIDKAASLSGVEPRLLVAAMFAEQSRLFRTERGLFKKYLAPLQILASENQFSLGVMGIKPATAQTVEKNLTATSSPFYLGPDYEDMLDFSTDNTASERYNRLVDEHDHSYSYLYGGLYIRQLEKQWEGAGFPINDRPEVIGTLYNIGFAHSTPNPDPEVGGSIISVNGTQYTFGSLVYEFYYSGELSDQFPFEQPKLQ